MYNVTVYSKLKKAGLIILYQAKQTSRPGVLPEKKYKYLKLIKGSVYPEI